MACSGDRDSDLALIASYYGSANDKNTAAMGYIQDAYSHWESHEEYDAIEDLCSACSQLWYAIDFLIYRFEPFHPETPIPHFLNAHTVETATVDMDGILSAMITAEFAQLQNFIGIVDAYRVALMNEPFNAEYYAALARGFRR